MKKWRIENIVIITAVGNFLVAVICFILCASIRNKSLFLTDNAIVNSGVIDGMKEMIRAGFFGIIPAVSVLLIINSLLLFYSLKRIKKNCPSKP